MRTYAVGDIQGCLQPLQCLLEAVHFKPGKDRLWSVGDTVNRGPKCLQTLRFLYNMRADLTLVLGNHDLHLLAVAAGVRAPGRSDTLDEILAAPDRDELLNWLLHQPLVHHEKGYTLVHAGIPPQWSIETALKRAAEVEAVLQSERCIDFFQAMYGNEPPVWSNTLRGMTRLRVITNYFTRMRYCTADGVLDFENKGATLDASLQIPAQPVSAWFSHPNRKAADDRILFGHWASIQGQTNTPNAIGLDTGCVWGGAMSLYCLETQKSVHCNCSTDHDRENEVS